MSSIKKRISDQLGIPETVRHILVLGMGTTNPKVVQVTALEQPIKESKQLPVSNNKVAFSMDRALSTLKLSTT
jgi:hypothetical protein